ncbi:Immature colon carcinoma transcript 1 protein [Echinococcus granulosus]|uniref:Large ribosomal subunit protein mL62 n=1 Tax=Echinococcus granulosus TaxID=6210 RepID=W6UER8_ECHGR|nr:Immature colon carcinoma transcript 1 protein [Echinococcus granulosus]EUB59543.1 Immature colon carcinoma transcript 1 protein [Echinococcus granulosus]
MAFRLLPRIPKLGLKPGQFCTRISRTLASRLALFVPPRSFSTNDPDSLKPATRKDIFDGFIPLNEIQISYSSASGPGGQHVNKNHTKVQIKFHIASATWIPEHLKPYLLEKESHRITKDGHFIIQSDRTRYQLLNQADCLERIRRMIRERLSEMNKPEVSAETLEKHRQCRIRENEKRLAVKRTDSMTKAYRRRPSQWDL